MAKNGKTTIRIKGKFLPKQKKALRVFLNHRNGIKQILFGGAAGGGKSVVGCACILIMALMYPGTRYLIGRSRLKTLKESTLVSFFFVCGHLGLEEGTHYTYNETACTVKLFNGSVILMKDLYTFPTDPDFDRLGSLEVTAAFVDEGNQCSQKAIDILLTRIRYRLMDFCDKCGAETAGAKVLKRNKDKEPEVFQCKKCGCETEGLFPKMIITCNPAKNWVYNLFYKPFKDGELDATRYFIPAKSGDNPKLSKHYLSSLDSLDDQSKARLKEGSWEHSDPYSIFKPDPLAEMFAQSRDETGSRYFLAIDPSGEGQDAAEFVVMSENMTIVEWVTLKGSLKPSDLFEVADRLIDFYNIDQYDIAFDSDGLGFALIERYEYGYHIKNGGAAIYNGNYRNLKTQLYFRLARMINEGKIAINCWTHEIEKELTQELQVLQKINIDSDGKIDMTRKDQVRQKIGRSPNKSDALAYMMRHFMQDLDNSYIVF